MRELQYLDAICAAMGAVHLATQWEFLWDVL
jgi:hypothetical protein